MPLNQSGEATSSLLAMCYIVVPVIYYLASSDIPRKEQPCGRTCRWQDSLDSLLRERAPVSI
eukprot:12575658-Ditylum_brightwellii.AAC.1